MASTLRAFRPALVVGIGSLLVLIFYMNPNMHLQFVPQQNYPRLFEGRRLQATERDPGVHDDPVIDTVERSYLDFHMGGYLFKESGRSYFINASITSCLIHSFSPYIEKEAAKRFVDPAHDNIYFANSPAVTWFNGELVLVSRIWLDREKYEPKNDWPANHFADNFLYTQKFDRHMKPVSNASIMGIPSPKQWWVGDGPIEPRIFSIKDRLFVTFNAAMAFEQQVYMDYTIMWDYVRNMPIIPKIKGGTPMMNATDDDSMPRDKHWMALIDGGELYFVHNLDPLRVLKCDLEGFCEFVHNEQGDSGFIFQHQISHLRGGTPFELYEWPYYISVAHSTMYKSQNRHRYYTAHIVVLSVQPTYRVVYVGNEIKVHEDVYKAAPMVRPAYIDDGFIFPVGLLLETPDMMTVGVHVNDFSSVLIRVKGMRSLMKAVIEADIRQRATKGAPIGYLHKHIHDVMQNNTHMEFIH